MKRSLAFCLLLWSVLAAHAAYRDEILADQPVGYWRLGETTDATAAVNAGSLGAPGNGELINTVVFGSEGAILSDPDTAAYFGGDQSKVQIPYAAELNPAAFTIEAWARVSSDSAGYRSPLASRDDSPQRGFIFYCDPSNNWQFWTGTGEQVGWNVVGGAIADPDVWAHLVGTYDGTNKLFYVNGVLVGANQSPYAPNASRVLRIGASATESPVGDFFFVGDIDEVAVYGAVLPTNRVMAHFKAGSGSDPSPDVAPTLAVQPAPASRFRGESVSLVAIAVGSLPISYQWKKDDADITGATGSSLHLSDLQPGDSGTYTVVARNAAGEIGSDPVTLDVADSSKPVITTQPRNRTVLPGANAAFSVAATGSTTFGYQWQFNNQPLDGATNATLTLTNVQSSHLGAYKVTVTNPAGVTDSDPATLQFPAAATQSYTATVRQDNPTAYWRLGESTGEIAEDTAGDNDGTLLNGVILGRPGAPAGDTDTAAGFTTELQTKIDVPWSESLNSPVFTVECWAKVTGGAGVHRSPLTSRADFPQRGYIFYAEPGNTWQFWIGTGDQGGWVSLQGPAVAVGAYAHLVGVYDGTLLSFYVNGILAAQQTAAFAVNDASPLRIGAGATEGDGAFFFEGDIDEVAIFDKALSEERILAHFVAGYPLTTPPAITSQPLSQAAPPGATVRFTASASGGVPLLYQWRFSDQDIPGATTSSLVLSNVSSANAGPYRVVVSNAGGTVTSDPANLVIPTPPTQPYVDLVKAAGPVAYWRLGESAGAELADDEIGTSDGLYLEGVTLGVPGAIDGDANTAANFTSSLLQKVDVEWSEILNPPNFTVEIWARVTGGDGNYRSPMTSRADSPQRGYIFYAEPGNTWQFWTGKGDTSGWDNIPGPAVVPNAWTHLAASYDGALKRFYVNGVLVGTSTTAFAVNDQSALRIGGGASEGPGNYFFEGDVDEPAIYDKVVTHEEIIRHFLAGAPSSEAPELTFARSGANLVLTWTSGALESSPSIPGTWTPVANAASPFTVQPTGQASYYRLRQ